MEMTKTALAQLTGKVLRRIQQIDAELPDSEKLFVKGNEGKYDAALFVQRWVQYNTNKAMEDTEKLNYDQVRAQHELLKIQKTEIDIAVRRGELLDTEEVRELWDNIVTTVRNRLMHIPTTAAQRLVMMKDPAEIKAILDREIRTVLELMASSGIPERVDNPEDEEEPETEE